MSCPLSRMRAKPATSLKDQEKREAAADAWDAAARGAQDALLTRWALTY